MTHISENLSQINTLAAQAALSAGRKVTDITLIAVSKTYPAATLRLAYDEGQRHFGENKLQEGIEKMPLLPSDIHWHFIGRIQSNKIRKILTNFQTIHSIDTLAHAQYANQIAAELGLYPEIFLQINLATELTKGGFDRDELYKNWETLITLPRLQISGLMCIPPEEKNPDDSRKWFHALRELRDDLNAKFHTPLPYLSMGMSHDFPQAILEGATHIRVGSAIFGKRNYA